MLNKIGDVHFRLLGTNGYHFYKKNKTKRKTNGYHLKAKNYRFTTASSRCCQKLKYENSRPHLTDYVENCTKKRDARAARLVFPIESIKIKSFVCERKTRANSRNISLVIFLRT